MGTDEPGLGQEGGGRGGASRAQMSLGQEGGRRGG